MQSQACLSYAEVQPVIACNNNKIAPYKFFESIKPRERKLRGRFFVQFPIFPQPQAFSNLCVTGSKEDGVSFASEQSGKLYFIFFAALVSVVSCTKENPTPAPSSLEMVDLGLSVKWASCNVGATKPEEYGTYFAWGDVTGQTWDGSKWSGGGFSKAPSYEVDAKGNLKPEFDAAHINLGGDWRMPTKEECQALIDNCTSTWVKNYQGTRVAGCVFTSKINGNSIFMPAGGRGYNYDLNYAGSGGYYWSSTFSGDNYAWYLRFSSGDVSTNDNYCLRGQSVRAVADKAAPDPSVVIDLSAAGTSNCYNVPFSGNFKFKATVKGNSTESVGNPASAEVLWESFGTSVAPSKGDIVKNVFLENGSVKLNIPYSRGPDRET